MKHLKLKIAQRVKKLKDFWRCHYRVILGIFLSAFLLLAIFVSVSLFLAGQGSLALYRLRLSFQEEVLCHESCHIWRRQQGTIIVNRLKKDGENSYFAAAVRRTIANKKEGDDYRIFLAAAWKESFSKSASLSKFLALILSDDLESGKFRSAILALFSQELLASAPNPVAFYLSLLEKTDTPPALRREALRALSNPVSRGFALKEDDLDILKRLLFSAATAKSVRHGLIMLCGSYYNFFPDATVSILEAYYKLGLNDNIGRFLAAEVINRGREGAERLSLPEITAAEWQLFYEDENY